MVWELCLCRLRNGCLRGIKLQVYLLPCKIMYKHLVFIICSWLQTFLSCIHVIYAARNYRALPTQVFPLDIMS